MDLSTTGVVAGDPKKWAWTSTDKLWIESINNSFNELFGPDYCQYMFNERKHCVLVPGQFPTILYDHDEWEMNHIPVVVPEKAKIDKPDNNIKQSTDVHVGHQKDENTTGNVNTNANSFQVSPTDLSRITNLPKVVFEKNQKLLHSIISCIVYCGRQNIAVRGHVESTDGENNPGNFLALLKFRADVGDKVLANHFSQAGNRAKYTSPTIQNELISILGEQIRESIVNQIPSDAPYFSILADKVIDVSNREQLSLVIRFIDSDGNIHEEFLGFHNLQRITGEAIASSILDTLPQWNLDIKNCWGQGYDGASNMLSSSTDMGKKSKGCVHTLQGSLSEPHNHSLL